MRKSIITLVLLCFTLSSFAQQSEEETNFVNMMRGLSKSIAAAAKTKNYKQAEKLCMEAISTYEKLSQDHKEKYKLAKGSFYYDLTCCLALQGKKKEAVKSFAICYENGWNKYYHAKKDTDLDKIRKEKEFINILEEMRKEADYIYILQQAKAYDRNQQKPICYNESITDTLPKFTYMNPNDSNLVRIREHFNLDSIAGSGNEISKIKNLLYWVHNVVRHDGSSYNPTERNAIAMVELCKKENRGVNCRMLAQILNECYLAMGFKSRFVTCMPKKYINDCHVINAVYSNTLNKWLWVDPTNNAYVMDENGNMLSIQEVRDRLRTDQPLVLNEDANWNNLQKQTKENYLDQYMAKNLFYVNCPLRSEYNAETDYEGKNWSYYVALMPIDYTNERENGVFTTNNDVWFWQSPYQD